MQNQSDSGASPNMTRLRKNTRKMKKKASRRRARTLLLLIAAAAVAVVLLTPVFDIRSVTVEGTDKVGAELTEPITESVKGQNLFTVGIKSFKASFEAIPYVKQAQVRRRIYPPSLVVTVTECVPVAYTATAGGFIVLDDDCKVLEIAIQPPTDIPQITGVSIKNPVAGQKIDVDEKNKSDIIVLCMKNLGPLSSKIKNIDVTDTENISFDYENRLRVLCGSSIDFSDKIQLFSEVINSNRLEYNARGTIDLSDPGKAVHIP